MANEPVITVHGNLTADPELRYTQSGLAVANLTIAQTPRDFDRTSNEWKEGEALFMRGSIWREYAENVAASLRKGQHVLATGRLKQRSFQDKETGANRTSYELEIDEIGPSLRFGQASFTRNAPKNQAAAPAQYAPQAPVAQAAAPAQYAPQAPVAAPVQYAPAAPVAQPAPVQYAAPAAQPFIPAGVSEIQF